MKAHKIGLAALVALLAGCTEKAWEPPPLCNEEMVLLAKDELGKLNQSGIQCSPRATLHVEWPDGGPDGIAYCRCPK